LKEERGGKGKEWERKMGKGRKGKDNERGRMRRDEGKGRGRKGREDKPWKTAQNCILKPIFQLWGLLYPPQTQCGPM